MLMFMVPLIRIGYLFAVTHVFLPPSQVILCGIPRGSPAESAVNDPPLSADPTALTYIHCTYSYFLTTAQ